MTRMDFGIGATLVVLAAAHYSVSAHVLWIHVILFWLFQVPILLGGVTRGFRGGLMTASLAAVMLLPHAVGLSRHHGLSANAIWMDLATLFIIGGTTGWLRDRLQREKEMGERVRELTSLKRFNAALQQDLSGPVRATRGLLLSLEPMRARSPALAPSLHGMDLALEGIESLIVRLRALRIDPRLGLVRLDRVLEATQERLTEANGSAPTLKIEWLCQSLLLPASVVSLGSAIATLLRDLMPPGSEVRLSVSTQTGSVLLDIRQVSPPFLDGAPFISPPKTSLEIAYQVIRAHGGRVEGALSDDGPGLRVFLPTMLRIRPLPQHPSEERSPRQPGGAAKRNGQRKEHDVGAAVVGQRFEIGGPEPQHVVRPRAAGA